MIGELLSGSYIKIFKFSAHGSYYVMPPMLVRSGEPHFKLSEV